MMARFENGVSFRIRYGKLLDKFQGIPVIRTTSQGRCERAEFRYRRLLTVVVP